ncbi:MAG: hypothetical protein LIP00_12510 [Parabacteroides sp.]|nr:hypothetical protein [Parabacteroides sp.]
MDGPISAFMFCCIVNEALGYTHEEALDSSYVVLLSLLREHAFMVNRRNKLLYGDPGHVPDGDCREVVDFTTGKPRRVKKVRAF